MSALFEFLMLLLKHYSVKKEFSILMLKLITEPENETDETC